MSNGRILIISNGHGEDLIAARLAQSLKELRPSIQLEALPIVGLGSAFSKLGISLLLEGKQMPSGGFIRNGLKNIKMDLQAGLISHTRRQLRVLKAAREGVDLAFCVGDAILLLFAGWVLKRPIVFLPTAKSNYIAPHWKLEIDLMRRYCTAVFPRDLITAKSLQQHGVKADFYGNVMMDALEFKGDDLKKNPGEIVVTILPGGREEAYDNLLEIGKVVLEFEKLCQANGEGLQRRYLVALSGGLEFSELVVRMPVEDWQVISSTLSELERGIIGHFGSFKEQIRLTVTQGRFADLLKASDLVIGLAGTANEQAVGMGKPVVTFVGNGPQFTKKFAITQQKLLGDSISLVESEPGIVAAEMWWILKNPELYEKMAQIGRERMGKAGGSEQIAREILRFIDQVT